MRTYPQEKIFCIGMNKTGTTSIGDALQLLGYRRLGWDSHLSAHLTYRWHESNMEIFYEEVKKYDVFEDIPWNLVYKEMYAKYPNAKFILTLRKDSLSWLKSIQAHIDRTNNWVGHYLIFGSYNPIEDSKKYVHRYEQHNEEVRAFFSDKPGKLLEMTFENGDAWNKLCPFLGIDEVDFDFPHSNKRPREEDF